MLTILLPVNSLDSLMLCPVCEFEKLTTVAAGDIQVDICDSECGGVWFDAKEVQRFRPYPTVL